MIASVIALRSKYEEMRSLRQTAPASPRVHKERLASLASRFPGALREIDALPMSEIDRRIEALSRAERDPSAHADWMHAMTRFHELTRGALFVKRELGARTPPTASWPREAELWRDHVAHIARPPRGRLMDLVYARLATELDTTPRKAKALVFGVRAGAAR